jgi:pyruvate dehydrogenase E2 component (dihydrolipoamide acetyltransferase)
VATAIEVLVPDIGGFKDVSVIDVLVTDGQQVSKETPLITIETEKAAMDVPAPAAGRITQVKLKQGDKVSEGSLILLLEPASAAEPAPATAGASTTGAAPTGAGSPSAAAQAASAPAASAGTSPSANGAVRPRSPPEGVAEEPAPRAAPARTSSSAAQPAAARATAAPAVATSAAATSATATPATAASIDERAFSKAYASPSVRKFAREVGADLGKITGTGPKKRITQDDVKAYVKRILSKPASVPTAQGSGLPKIPAVDFAKFGPVEIKPLSRIQRISGARLQASWINLPHVTQHDDADITDLETARGFFKDKAAREEVKLTPLVFIIKACILSLQKFPRFNASLDASGENLVFKQYCNIGFAADTPNGLVVPVIHDADRLDIYEIARALGALSAKARAGKLSAMDMQGGCFTVSSLGGIGGTAFTPIINAPEVAILGVSKSSHKPVYENGAFVPRLMLPLSLSYDHRVIDGAEAARFVVFLSKTLSDVKALI